MSQLSTSFMPISIVPFELQTSFRYSYRSHSVHKVVKHCIEGTYLSGPECYHIGFSPVSNERNFISFMRNTKDRVDLYQRTNPTTQKMETYPIKFQKGETFLVCLDSEESKLSVFYDDKKLEYSYGDFEKIEEWYAYFDTNINAGNDKVHVLFNLGFTKFNNTIPEGFFPWNYDITDLRGMKQQHLTISCRNHKLNIIFIYVIIN